ncbi:HNH endonuclease [Aestuariimicrobium soli]|uniref:HNH endonuclease n=1 Tax=Aestuariimicrobium soli TaxID=2035834 RepID=UPI003EBB17B4
MKIFVGVTDNNWAGFLRDHSDLTEANFWQPSPHNFKVLKPGEPFLFKTKDPRKFPPTAAPGYSLVGGGFFDQYVELRVSEAWAIWGQGNGVSSERELLSRARAYRGTNRGLDFSEGDPTIGCIILRNVFFAEMGAELPQPPHWATNIVSGRGYDLTGVNPDPDSEYVQQAFATLQAHARIDYGWDSDLRQVSIEWNGPRHGVPRLVTPRTGQCMFKLAVATAYRHRCAITGSATFPSLEAAHIRPFASGGAHAVSNGLLLRTDVHRLYDGGYLSIDPDLRLRVSPQLRQRGWNGVEFYQREAEGFRVTEPPDVSNKPDREALAWHYHTVFRAS